MPPGEVSVTCAGCGYRLQLPVSAIRRNNMYCPQCGKNIPLAGIQTSDSDGSAGVARVKPKKSSRPMRRR